MWLLGSFQEDLATRIVVHIFKQIRELKNKGHEFVSVNVYVTF